MNEQRCELLIADVVRDPLQLVIAAVLYVSLQQGTRKSGVNSRAGRFFLPEPKATDAYKQLKTGKNILSRGGLNCLSWNGCHGRLQVGDRHNLHREREDEQGQV